MKLFNKKLYFSALWPSQLCSYSRSLYSPSIRRWMFDVRCSTFRRSRLCAVLPQLAVCLLAGVLFGGCTVVNYNTSNAETFNMPLNVKKQYSIVSVECIIAESITVEKIGKEKSKLDLLSAALNNQPGDNFGDYWKNTVADLNSQPDYHDIAVTNLSAWKLNTRSIAPTLFVLNDGMPINIRAIMFIRPESVNPWWVTAYALSATILAPLQSSSLGAANVAILDANGKTVAAKTVIFRRSVWFSTMFPWALCGAGKIYIASGGNEDFASNETNLQIQIMSQMIAEMLSDTPVKADKNWRNIRAATVEAIASDNSAAALKMIKAATLQNVGNNESYEFLDIL